MSQPLTVSRVFSAEFFEPVWRRRWCHEAGNSSKFVTKLEEVQACSGRGVDDPHQIQLSANTLESLTVGNGLTLQERLDTAEFSDDESDLRALGEQLCIGLLRLHDGLGVRHGALCPYNVRIADDGSASLWSVPTVRLETTSEKESRSESLRDSDWLRRGAMARRVTETTTSSKQAVSIDDNVQSYLAPEEPHGSFLSDVYSIGAILYRAMVGRRAFSDTPPGRLERRHVANAAGLSDEFVSIVLKCLETDPLDRYLGLGKLVRALNPESLAIGLQIAPGRELVQTGLSRYRDSRLPEARALFEESSWNDFFSVAAWNNIAVVQMRAGEYLDAVFSLEKAYNLSSSHPVVSSNIAQCFLNLGDKVAVRYWAEQARTINPRLVRPYLSLGELALQEGKVDEALTYATGAVMVDPSCWWGRYFKFQVHEALGMRSKARLEETQLERIERTELLSDCLIDESCDVPWFLDIDDAGGRSSGDDGHSSVPQGPTSPSPRRSASLSYEERLEG